ncbi:MAG: non-ribosomal peptide synthetase [Chitinophagaceae bacterium]
MKSLLDVFKKIETSGSGKGIYFIKGRGNIDFLSYRELCSEARFILHQLKGSGIRPGHQVVLQMQSDRNFVRVFWACILGGIIPVPVTSGLNRSLAEKMINILDVLDAPYIVTDMPGYGDPVRNDIAAHLGKKHDEQRIIEMHLLEEKEEQAAYAIADEQSVAFLQFSSGSTGDPKGVINTHGSILQNVADIASGDYVDDTDVTLGWMPLTHDMGMICFHIMPLMLNFDQYLMSPIVFMSDPALWAESIATHQVSIAGAPNFGFAYYMKHCSGKVYPVNAFSRLRVLLSGAEQINSSICNSFLNEMQPFGMDPGIFKPTYGLAEATLYVTGKKGDEHWKVHSLDRSRLQVGDRIETLDPADSTAVSYVNLGYAKSTRIEIRDHAGVCLPENHVGKIFINGPCITKGYYNNPDETSRAIDADGWLDTGDLGFLTNQTLVVTGRVKELIIHRGQNYYPADIDRAILTAEWLSNRQVACCGIFNNTLQQDDVVVFITHRSSVEDFVPVMQAVRKIVFINLGLEVARVVPVDDLPRTTSGKIQRFVLKERYLKGEFDGAITQMAHFLLKQQPNQLTIPKNKIEEKLVSILSRHLNGGFVNVRENFFDMGMNSLLVQEIKAEVEEELNIRIDDIALYKHPTIRAFAGYLNEQVNETPAPQVSSRSEAFAAARNRLKRP